MNDQKQYEQWKNKISTIELPHWNELPKFDLYMDQVVALINGILGPLGVETITASMINNYVKNKAIMAPNKKKYQTMQIADIILINLLKPTFSLSMIREGIDQITANKYPQQAYDDFIDRFTNSLRKLKKTDEPVTAESLSDELSQVAVDAIINRIKTQKILEIINKPIQKV